MEIVEVTGNFLMMWVIVAIVGIVTAGAAFGVGYQLGQKRPKKPQYEAVHTAYDQDIDYDAMVVKMKAIGMLEEDYQHG